MDSHEVAQVREACESARSLLSDLATDYDLDAHAATHQFIDIVTTQLSEALRKLT